MSLGTLDLDIQPFPKENISNDVEKLSKLKRLLFGALQQIRKKLSVVETAITAINSPSEITSETKLLCTILVEIRELLKHFPAITPDEDEPPSDYNSDINSKIQKFRRNVQLMLRNILERLQIVEEFVDGTNSLPQAMTVAVTIRDITMHLKIVSPHKGTRVISVPGAIPKIASSSSMNTASVSNIVNFYSNLGSTARKASHDLSVSRSKLSLPLDKLNEHKNEIPESNSEELTPLATSRLLHSKEQKIMEEVVNVRMETITKKRGGTIQSMLKNGNVSEFFDDATPAISKKSITRLSDEGTVYYSGELSKRYYSMMGFGKAWKTHFWVLDTKKLSCFQSEKASIPLKTYAVEHIKSCSWTGNLKTGSDLKLDSVHFTTHADRKFTLQANSEFEMIRWVCAIDTVQNNCDVSSILHPLDKHRLLKTVYKDKQKGGEVQSSYEEDWSYSADGLLQSSIGVSPKLSYRWDGEMLIGVDTISRQLGSGKWDGISLIWYNESSNGFISTPSVRFDWNQKSREYSNAMEPTQVWKWTRHFLASKFGAGEWIVEGDIPEPVVMFLQMIRTCRLQQTVEECKTESEGQLASGGEYDSIPDRHSCESEPELK